MPDMRLYSVRIPDEAQMQSQSQSNRNQAAQGVLGSGTGAVESLSLDPNEKRVRGQFRAQYAELMAVELEELFRADGVDLVPYYGVQAPTPEDGYYTVKSGTRKPVDPREPRLQQYDGVLTRAGSRESDLRAVTTNPRRLDHPFGNTEVAHVGIPATATDVQWFDPTPETTEDATPVATRTGEFGDLDVYDALASNYSKPVLVYDLPYDEVGRRDVRVWDDYGRSKFDAEGVNRWQKVFRTDHDWVGVPRVDNTRIRLAFDAGANSLTAETWDPGTDSWTATALGSSSWELAAVDVREISDVVVTARVRFQDPTQSPTATYELDCQVVRGGDYPLWSRPENETAPFPAGLADLLDPIASANDYEPQPVQKLVARPEVET